MPHSCLSNQNTTTNSSRRNAHQQERQDCNLCTTIQDCEQQSKRGGHRGDSLSCVINLTRGAPTGKNRAHTHTHEKVRLTKPRTKFFTTYELRRHLGNCAFPFTSFLVISLRLPPISSGFIHYQQMAYNSRQNKLNNKIDLTSQECRAKKNKFVFLDPTIYRTLQKSE